MSHEGLLEDFLLFLYQRAGKILPSADYVNQLMDEYWSTYQ